MTPLRPPDSGTGVIYYYQADGTWTIAPAGASVVAQNHEVGEWTDETAGKELDRIVASIRGVAIRIGSFDFASSQMALVDAADSLRILKPHLTRFCARVTPA